MLFLPIVDRELRIAARNWRTYYSRSGAGAVALLVSLYLVILVRAAIGGPAAGVQVLGMTSILALGFCLYSGVSLTCDCLSSEKREDTLGLLFLTHLKGYDVVLGKLFANSLRTIFLLLGTLPILSIPVFLGGVSGLELLRIPLVLLNSLFLAVALGILVSSTVRSQRAAHLAGGMLITVLAGVLPASAVLVQRFSNFPWLALPLNLPSPTYTLQMAFGNALGLSTNLFWMAIAVQFTLALLSIIAASIIVPHAWQVKAGTPWRFKDWLAQVSYGSAQWRARRRRRMLDRNPIYWLAFRDRSGPFWPALFAVLSLGLTLFLVLHYEIPREPAFIILFFALGLNDFGMRIRVGSLASLRFGQDRQNGALETILSTPLTIREILRGQWMAIRQKLLWTYVPLLVISASAAHYLIYSWGGKIVVPWFFILLSVGDFIAMGYVGMWKGMHKRNVQHAAGAALLRVLIAPWVIWATLIALVNEVDWVRPYLSEIEPYGVIISATLVWALSTVIAVVSARRKLFAHFREAATDRYTFERRTSLFVILRRWSDSFLTFNLLRSRQPPVLN
jgi:hypothetical protein